MKTKRRAFKHEVHTDIFDYLYQLSLAFMRTSILSSILIGVAVTAKLRVVHAIFLDEADCRSSRLPNARSLGLLCSVLV